MSMSTLEAKQFLVNRIAEEAKREGAPLNEVEMSMLGFAESEASFRAMELARTFEHDYDDKEYEDRIARLARAVYDRDLEAGKKAEWDGALDELAAEDMYLFVMLERAGLVKTTTHLMLPDWRLLIGLAPALVCVALAILVAATPLAARLIPNALIRIGIALLLLLVPLALDRLHGGGAG